MAAKRAAKKRVFPIGLAVGVVGIVAIVLMVSIIAGINAAMGRIQQDDPRRATVAPSGLSAVPAVPGAAAPAAGSLGAPFNILLVGVDRRTNPEEGVRSDTLIAVHVDPQQKTAAMLSIPRDTIVQVPNVGQAKINTAFATGYNNAEQIYGRGTAPDAGGGALAAETVEQFLGVKIDYVAQVDFSGFAQLVDAIGGVPIDLQQPLLDAEYPTDDYGVQRIYMPAGLQVMDGATALTFARSRHSSDDFGRAKRQQMVLRAILQQIKARGLVENASAISKWLDVLSANVRTTLPLSDPATLTSLAALAREISPDHIVQLSLNPDDAQLTMDGSDLYWNQADVEALVARWQGAAGAAGGAAARIQVLNASNTDGVATKITESLRAQGFQMLNPDNAITTSDTSRLIDFAGRPEVAQRLAAALGLPASAVVDTPGPGDPPEAEGVDIVLLVGNDFEQAWLGGR
ncbi:LytR family transcriptional regulator [Chloroflexia bacterium SDU3-3]|nr:LytR family transcriptional regulator [Chloroflexia bacterium SDU3-3]